MFVWDVDPVLLRFGPVQVRYYGVFFGLTLLGGFLLWRWQMLRAGRSEEQAQRFLVLGLAGVVIGSKVGHVLFYRPDTLLHDPLEVLAFWKGGLSSHGATLGLIAALTYFAHREKMRFADVADRLAMSIAWGATLVRVGNLFNSEIVGRVTGVPWAVKFPRHDLGLPLARVPWRHPSQLYEVAIGLFVLFILYAVDRRLGEERPVG
ncbi:MAG: prolipoprotein diacylglyceryl transferase, partial [Proteobacteria bacterium]|nr:prolipoprotein diacylglyceryl transferase [Pseudomonadota bacterium]